MAARLLMGVWGLLCAMLVRASVDGLLAGEARNITGGVLGSSRRRRDGEGGLDEGMTGDMYVLAFTWTPEFCFGHSRKWPGCASPHRFWRSHFTLHGLWPQYSAGGYPTACSTESFDVNAAKEVGWNLMVKYWPNVKYSEQSQKYGSFWEHEWTKHGTCSGLPQVTYLQASIDAIKEIPTPKLIASAAGQDISTEDAREALGGSDRVALQCQAGKYLSGAYLCLSADEEGRPSSPRVCPADVLREDSCSNSVVTVQSFGNRKQREGTWEYPDWEESRDWGGRGTLWPQRKSNETVVHDVEMQIEGVSENGLRVRVPVSESLSGVKHLRGSGQEGAYSRSRSDTGESVFVS